MRSLFIFTLALLLTAFDVSAQIYKGRFVGDGTQLTNVVVANMSGAGYGLNQVPGWNGTVFTPTSVLGAGNANAGTVWAGPVSGPPAPGGYTASPAFSGININANSIGLASLANGTSGYLLGYNNSGVAAGLNSINVNYQVSGINANWQVTNWQHTIWVETYGNDANNGTNSLSPFQTLTNALALALSAGGTNVIYIGPGVFPVPSNTLISANTMIIGSGQQMTTVLPPTNGNASGIIIAGDNVSLFHLRIGTNANAGFFYFPTVPRSGTNFLAEDVSFEGDSDAFYAGAIPALTAYFSGTFRFCGFKSGYDGVNIDATGSGATSAFKFLSCTFSNLYDANFSGTPMRGFVFSASGVATFENCLFNLLNNSAATFTEGIHLDGSGCAITASANIYNVANSGASPNNYGIYNQFGTLTIVGAINPALVDTAAGGTTTYDSSRFVAVTSYGATDSNTFTAYGTTNLAGTNAFNVLKGLGSGPATVSSQSGALFLSPANGATTNIGTLYEGTATSANAVTTNGGIVYVTYQAGSNLLVNLAPYTNVANLIIAVVCTNWLQVTFSNVPPAPFLFRALQGPSLTNSVWFNTNLAQMSNSFPCHYNTNLTINLIPTTSTNSCLDFPISLNGATNINVGPPAAYAY